MFYLMKVMMAWNLDLKPCTETLACLTATQLSLVDASFLKAAITRNFGCCSLSLLAGSLATPET